MLVDNEIWKKFIRKYIIFIYKTHTFLILILHAHVSLKILFY